MIFQEKKLKKQMKQPYSGEDFFFFKIFGGDKKKMDLILKTYAYQDSKAWITFSLSERKKDLNNTHT